MIFHSNTTKSAKRLVKKVAVTVALLLCAVCTDTVQGAPLDLTLQPSPNMFADIVNVHYDSTMQKFTASGFVENIDNGTATPIAIVNGKLEISASLASDGTFRDGSLTISGEIPTLGISQGKLLAGDLSSFGFGVEDGILEFKFATNDGSLYFQYGPVTKVILGQSGFSGTFARNFNNGAIGIAGIGW